MASDDVDSAAGFGAWIARITATSDTASCRWIVEHGRVLGGIALRHGGGDDVQWAGHVGFGVRPSARRRGIATWATHQMLSRANDLGMDRVLLVCAVDNLASGITIERVGGILEGIGETPFGPARRYWVTLSRTSATLDEPARRDDGVHPHGLP